MTDILKLYVEGKSGGCLWITDRTPKLCKEMTGDRPLKIIFVNKGFSIPVLQLRPPTWLAKPQRTHFIIGYPIIISPTAHEVRVYVTKIIAALFFILCLFFGLYAIRILVRRRRYFP